MQSDVTISLAQIVWICGGITAIAAFIKWVMTPIKRIDDHEHRIGKLEDAEAARKATDRYTTKALNAIVNYMIDEGSKDELKKVRDEYQNSVINQLK